ncbi:MAG TPA: hypothetical protein ENK03_04110 [Candidatus Cloacimonetes bacterium]|nr:hypothetical protein [Candidatus Cloacimonadota bacterium]
MKKDNNTATPKNLRIPKYVRIILGVLIGMLLGYIWHRVIGCRSGACPIASNYLYSLVVGGLMGLIGSLIR